MNYVFEITDQEAQFIVMALQEMPAKFANPLTKKLQEQAQEQEAKLKQQE